MKKFSDAMSEIKFGKSPKLAIAVSGGADSMALLLLAHEWLKKDTGKIVALTVDHGLRKESKKEAEQVSAWCKKYNIEHHTLKWKAPKLNKAIQEQARDARYKLLTDWCKKNKVKNLLTAHHRGDQAETLFFRLARGSNLRGLACISPSTELYGVRLLRPLLDISKNELMNYLRKNNQPWIEDPSNQNPNYTRNSIRAQIQALKNSDDIEARAAKVAAAFGHIRAVLDQKTDSAFKKTIRTNKKIYEIDATKFRELAPEIAFLVTAKLIAEISQNSYPPRTEKLERLCSWLKHPDSKRSSLAHVDFEYLPKKGCFKASFTR